MSLIFGSVFLFILISPGLLFRFSYLQGTYAKLNFKVSAVEEVFWALVPTFFLHLTAVIILEYVTGYAIRLDIIYQLITGDSSDFQIIKQSLLPFLIYLFVLIVIGVLLGILVRLTIRRLKLDFYLNFLRFGNEWHYLLSGEFVNYPKKDSSTSFFKVVGGYLRTLRNPPKKVQWIQVDALMNSSEGDVIYSGILKEYFLSKDNGLDRIYLSQVYRRKYKKDLKLEPEGDPIQQLDDRYYPMPGYLLVIRYDKVINLNITYYSGEPGELTQNEFSVE
jgi:hypothetical protein